MIRALLPLLFLLPGCAATEHVYARPRDRAVADGVEYLVSSQNPDGSWGSGRDTTDFSVLAGVPGSHDAFRVATTALCVMALRESGEREASRRGLDYLVAYDGARRANRQEMYNIWAHSYGLQALARAYREDGKKAYREAAERHIHHLEIYETFVGGWNYYDFVYGTRTPSMEPTSFGTATALEALHEARRSGIKVPEGLVRRALARLSEMRKPDGSFLYGSDYRYIPLHMANQTKGSLGRTQAGHYVLQQRGEKGIGDEEIRAGLDGFFKHHRFMDIGRKRQYPHEAWYFTSGYYYYYGQYYASLLIDQLEEKGDYPARLGAHVLPHQEPDGSWWDYRMYSYHKPYGTAFAIMTLHRCRG